VTPERMAALVTRWVRFYTRDLPAPIVERRIEEINADLRDNIAHERAAGMSDPRIARGIASRMVRGIAADVAWRMHQPRTTRYRSVIRVGVGVAVILSVPFVAMQFTDEVIWSLADFVLAGALLTTLGVALELAARKAGNLATAIGIAAVGVAAAILGQTDDAPGLVLLGLLLIVSACALGVRTAQRKS
jgi:hypothetical protein